MEHRTGHPTYLHLCLNTGLCDSIGESEGDDGVTNEKCSDELTKLFERKLGEEALASFVARIDSVYDTVRTVCYLSDKGDGPLGWNDLNN